MAELDLNNLFDTFVAAEDLKEAASGPTLAPGEYRLRVEKTEPRVDDRPDARYPGRRTVRLTAGAFDRVTGERRGTTFFTASIDQLYIESNQGGKFLDRDSKLYGQLLLAFKVPEQSAGEFFKTTIYSGAFDATVGEQMKMPEGDYQKYKTLDERAALVERGGEPINQVTRIKGVK